MADESEVSMGQEKDTSSIYGGLVPGGAFPHSMATAVVNEVVKRGLVCIRKCTPKWDYIVYCMESPLT